MTDKTAALARITQAIDQYYEETAKDDATIRLHEPTFGAEETKAALDVLLSTYVTMGKEVKAFEADCAEYFQTNYALMSNSGSSANLLALAALANPAYSKAMQPGDEVLVPALSWSTTVWPIIQHQLIPVFVDCDPQTLNMDMAKAEKALTKRTRAIMPVHVYGNPCDMDEMVGFSQSNNLHLIEDCCESMGASFKGKPLGSFGVIGTYSTYFSHHITTLEGGINLTNDFEIVELMRVLRAHGWSREADSHEKIAQQYPDIDPRFIFVNMGYNLRPTELQGRMGRVQLPKLSGFVDTRIEMAQALRDKLSSFSQYFDFHQTTPGGVHSYFGFTLMVKESAPFTRSDLASFLKSKDIESRPIIAGNIVRHPAMQYFEHRADGDFEHADRVMDCGLAIACHHAISMEQVDRMANVFQQFIDSVTTQ